MKKVSLIICLCFSFNVLASSGTVEEFDRIFDQYEYQLTVEWDQKDPAYLLRQKAKIAEELAGLRASGLSDKDILSAIESKFVDDAQLAELRSLRQELSHSSPEAFIEWWESHRGSLSTHGASWAPSDTFIMASEYFFIAAFISLIVYEAVTHPCGQIVYSEARHRNVCSGVKGN